MRTNESNSATVTVPTAAEAADTRRSIRRYAPTAIPQADLQELLRLAGRAPSAYNVQPWRWIVVQDDALKQRLAEAAYGQKQVLHAPATIVMVSDTLDALESMPESVHPDMPQDQQDAAVAGFRATFTGQTDEQREAWGNAQSNIALGYLLLLAESLGYGTSPMLGFESDKVKALLGLPAHVRIPALVSIGYPDEAGFRPHRLPAESLIDFR